MDPRAAAEQRAVDERDVGTPVLEPGALGRAGDTPDVVPLLEPQQRFDARPDDRVSNDEEDPCLLRQPRYSTARRALTAPIK